MTTIYVNSSLDFDLNKIELDNGELYYYEKGEGSPILYIHSAGGLSFTPVLDSLSQSHRVIVPVLPGFDGSKSLQNVSSMEGLASIMFHLLNQLNLKKVTVIGFSFGGWVASWMAVLHESIIKKLILLAPAGFRQEPLRKLTAEEWGQLLSKYPQNQIEPPKPHDIKKNNQQVVHDYHGSQSLDTVLLDRLSTFTSPTLIVFGLEDQLMPVECGVKLKQYMQHARLTYLPDAFHQVEIDQPIRLTNLIEKFIMSNTHR